MASSQKPFYILLGGIVVIGVAALVITRMNSTSVVIPANVVVTSADTTGFHGYELGSPNAPVTVVEFGDLECPACSAFSAVQFPDIKRTLIDAGKVHWIFRDYPLDGVHKHPRVTAHAAACANDQNKYWPVQEAIFRRQQEFGMADNAMPVLTDIMKSNGLDMDAWTACMKSAKYAGRIQASRMDGDKVGVPSTPTFVIAGKIYAGMNSDQMTKLVDSLIAAGATGTGTPAAHSGGK